MHHVFWPILHSLCLSVLLSTSITTSKSKFSNHVLGRVGNLQPLKLLNAAFYSLVQKTEQHIFTLEPDIPVFMKLIKNV